MTQWMNLLGKGTHLTKHENSVLVVLRFRMRWCFLKNKVRTAPEYRPDGVIPDKYRRLQKRVEGGFVSFYSFYTLPETNSSHLKMDGWNISFL